MINSDHPQRIKILEDLYREAFRTLDPKGEIPPIEVRFYPYIGINHTIRIRSGRVYVRIADVCRNMAVEGHRALAFILVAKLFRKRVPANARKVYDAHTKTAEMRERAAANKRSRGRKVITTDKGTFFDLSEMFDELNIRYFGGSIEKPILTWSARKTYRILGHHDAAHQTIVVSRSLDSRDVPKYVVQYVVFHEMLHVKHPTVHHNGRRYNHTPAFRADEERFESFEAAETWIERNVRKLKRNVRKK